MQCPNCGSPIKTVPAGYSQKYQKSYPAFQACSNRNCNYKPPKEPVQPQYTQPQQPITPQVQPMKNEIIISYEKDLMVSAVDLVRVEILSGINPVNCPQRVLEVFRTLQAEFRNQVVKEYFANAYPEPEFSEEQPPF